MPVPALIACTSPAFVRPTFPMLSRWVTTPSRMYEMISIVAWPWRPKPFPGTISSSFQTTKAQGTKGPVGRIAVRTYYKVVIGLEPAKITAVERR